MGYFSDSRRNWAGAFWAAIYSLLFRHPFLTPVRTHTQLIYFKERIVSLHIAEYSLLPENQMFTRAREAYPVASTAYN